MRYVKLRIDAVTRMIGIERTAESARCGESNMHNALAGMRTVQVAMQAVRREGCDV